MRVPVLGVLVVLVVWAANAVPGYTDGQTTDLGTVNRYFNKATDGTYHLMVSVTLPGLEAPRVAGAKTVAITEAQYATLMDATTYPDFAKALKAIVEAATTDKAGQDQVSAALFRASGLFGKASLRLQAGRCWFETAKPSEVALNNSKTPGATATEGNSSKYDFTGQPFLAAIADEKFAPVTLAGAMAQGSTYGLYIGVNPRFNADRDQTLTDFTMKPGTDVTLTDNVYWCVYLQEKPRVELTADIPADTYFDMTTHERAQPFGVFLGGKLAGDSGVPSMLGAVTYRMNPKAGLFAGYGFGGSQKGWAFGVCLNIHSTYTQLLSAANPEPNKPSGTPSGGTPTGTPAPKP